MSKNAIGGDHEDSRSPDVDVVIPVFNGETTIERAIRSILEQNYSNFRVICIDDGSTDQTVNLVSAMHDHRITLIKCPKNLGQSSARNLAIQQSTSTYLAFLDADDEALPGRLLSQVNYLEEHPDIAVLGTQYISRSSKTTSNFPLRNWEIRSHLPFGNCIAMPTVMLRREQLVKAVGTAPFLDLHHRGVEDYDLWLRLQRHRGLKFRNLPIAGILYDDNIAPAVAELRSSESDDLRFQHFPWLARKHQPGNEEQKTRPLAQVRCLFSWLTFSAARLLMRARSHTPFQRTWAP